MCDKMAVRILIGVVLYWSMLVHFNQAQMRATSCITSILNILHLDLKYSVNRQFFNAYFSYYEWEMFDSVFISVQGTLACISNARWYFITIGQCIHEN